VLGAAREGVGGGRARGAGCGVHPRRLRHVGTCERSPAVVSPLQSSSYAWSAGKGRGVLALCVLALCSSVLRFGATHHS